MNSRTASGELWDALAEFRARVVDEMQGGVASLGLDLSMPQALALTAIFQGAPLTVSALQAKIHRSQATTSHLVTQLELRGLVERGEDPSDARRTVLRPSREGRRLMEKLEKLRRAGFERVLGRVPAPVRLQLEKALRATLDALEEGR